MTSQLRKALAILAAVALLALACVLPSLAELRATAEGIAAQATRVLGTVEVQATRVLATAFVGAEATLSEMLTRDAPFAAATPPPTDAASASISGEILTTTPERPALRLFAREVVLGRVYEAHVAQGQPRYTIDHLPAGTYVVVAWLAPQGIAGGYTSDLTLAAASAEEQDACGHALILVKLEPGQAFTGADIRCWGANFFTWITPAP
jgi:hypothetical protein